MNRTIRVPAVLAVLLVTAACATRPAGSRYGPFHRAITTSSPDAQRHFDAGLLLCYGFNHDEAVREFEAALVADPQCAMASWGIAYALGPNINLPLADPVVATKAHEQAQQALAAARARTVEPVETALLAAMAARYAVPPPADRTALDQAYADAMRGVHAQFPG